MLVYRVFPYRAKSQPGNSGHPMYLHRPQVRGRLDNQELYDTWYFGLTPEVPIAEVFAGQRRWSESMFPFPASPGSRRALGMYEVDEDLPILNMDDANTLVDRALRPTQVVSRNRSETQAWARKVFEERKSTGGERRWAGIKWWSYHRPHWTVIALMVPRGEEPVHSFVKVERLTVEHPAVVSTASTLAKEFVK